MTKQRIDNFDRTVWCLVGSTMGVFISAFFGWTEAAWILGSYYAVWLIVLALLTGRIKLSRRDKAAP